ncbi:MAG: hypothetical protein JXO51_08635 [Candidatus Aminicenantes bacterium]|nr:hypothetical protein [Candidatus Aminicenantes bacterium]
MRKLPASKIFLLMVMILGQAAALAGGARKSPSKGEVQLNIDVILTPLAGQEESAERKPRRVADVRIEQDPDRLSLPKRSRIRIVLKENGVELKSREELLKYKVELNGEEIKPESLTPLIRRDVMKVAAAIDLGVDNTYRAVLGEPGQKYTLTIKRYASFEARSTEGAQGITVCRREYLVQFKYYLGLNAGLFFPTEKSGYSYGLAIKDPSVPADQARPTLTEEVSYQVKVIVFTSLFPFGFNPARKALDEHRLHLNVGTEISKSILERIYLGVGYDLTYMSVNLFWSSGKRDALLEAYIPYINREIPNAAIGSVPLRKVHQAVVGISLSLPFNFAASLIGNLLGL